MATACTSARRFGPSGAVGRPVRRGERVVLGASVGEGSGTGSSSASSSAARSSSNLPSSTQDWFGGNESVAGPANNMVEALKANRSFRFIRAESRRLGERRLAAFASAVALTTLAFYRQDLLSQLGLMTQLPVEEVDGLLYFVICFNVVSLVLPKSRYDK